MTTEFPHLFKPFQIRGMALRNRIIAPPHGRIIADPQVSEADYAKYAAYWLARARAGLGWMDGVNAFIDNRMVPKGLRLAGLGAVIRGTMRKPNFRDVFSRFTDEMHAEGTAVTAQIIMQGAQPHSASGILANYTNNQSTHILTHDEIQRTIEEYAFTAREAEAAGLDGVEMHANHEDVMQLFISPYTNRRTDGYGGDFGARLRLPMECLAAMRAVTGPSFVIGMRFNMDEFFDGGYGLEEGLRIAKAFEASGYIDYIHCVVGNNWGAPSYVQPHVFRPAAWAEMAGRFRSELSIPVVYGGRVSDPVSGEAVIANGHADFVAIARAFFADADFVAKAKAGAPDTIRPCIGCNDCLHAAGIEGLPFGCSVNPRAGREAEPLPARVDAARRVTVVGGGPAGMEAAAIAAERGHDVTLWERAPNLGGAMRIAGAVPENAQYLKFIEHQHKRLADAGVTMRLGEAATAQTILAEKPDVVFLTTGSRPRGIDVPGADHAFVVEGRDVMAGKAQVGKNVVVIAKEDHMQPLTVASYLAEQGCAVRVIYQAPGVAPGVGKYSIGGILGKLTGRGVAFTVMTRVAEIAPNRLVLRDVYSGVAHEMTGFDTVVLACGGTPDAGLYDDLLGKVPELRIFGDAYVPNRILHATRQAYENACSI
ncbi:FAD-dependent oxidoreductase [Phaeovulum sp. NW3]|uniref:oxidoreductase n=1 Tax=Phaeovulum sp. NW3 TaxID=2934933 RepID=UPI00202028F2|nr:FAD-dependent oxidoreductase [Phaeovulum sp. NW3]MCL7466142.1 FAD-dependent oxidoreductase [Phaeovulum sp. NW3]